MKLKLETLIAFAALCGATFAEEPAKKEAPPAPAPAAAEAVETDEIDLDKFDDSADAARKVPKVKMAPPSAVTNAVVAAPAQGGAHPVATAATTNAVDAAKASTDASPEPIPQMAVSTGLVDIDCDDATLA
ncbi:MAG: hypothetical protein IJQ00_13610, partial [Kiritimatiellae bacterium]|nr:hypothetical protein [Kiritimatiellia bacterium]